MRIGRSILLKSLLVLLLCVATIIPVIANSGSKNDDAPVSVKSAQNQDRSESLASNSYDLANPMLEGSNVVKINDQIEMRLTQLQMMPDTESQIVSFTLTIVNDSALDLNFIDYWIQLKTIRGTEYSINYLTSDVDQDLIPARSAKDFQFYAEVAPDLTYDDFIFELIAWDFNAPNYRKVIGSIKAPKGYSPLIKQGQTGVLRHANSRYHFHIDELYVNFPDEEEEDEKKHLSNTKEVELNLVIENMSSRSTPLPNVSYSLLTDDGYIYLLEPTGAVESSLAPRIETTLTLGGVLPETLDLTSTNFLIFSNGERVDLPLALYELPEPSDKEKKDEDAPEPQEIKLGERFIIELERTNIEMSVLDYVLVEQKDEKEEEAEKDSELDKEVFYDATISVLFENSGRFSGIISDYDYTIQFVETGDVFPLTVQSGGSIPLHPRMKHEQLLTVTLPEELINQSVMLIIRSLEPDDSGKVNYDQVASFHVPEGTIETEDEPEKPDEPEKEIQKFNVRDVYQYETEQGTYYIYLEQIQRYPWENEDIVAAKFIVINAEQNTLQLPNITGTFKLDGILLKDYTTRVVTSNKVLGIAPGQTIEMMVYTKIPYNFNFSSSGLIVSGLDNPPIAEDEKDQLDAIDDVEFINNTSLATIKQVEVGEKVLFDYITTSTELYIRDLLNYKGDDSQTVYIQAEFENLENRESRLPALKAYLRADNHLYIPLDVQYDGTLTPGGKALVVFSSTIAKRYNVDNMQLIIGELTPEQDGYLNTIAINLPPTKETVEKRAPYDLDIYPYLFTMNNVEADFNYTDSIRFEYELSLRDNFEILPGGQHLVIEFVDDDAKFERSYLLGKDLKLGTHNLNFLIDIPPNELIDLMNGFDRFTINIYSEYDGNRILLSSTNYSYF